jgi:hypothetical protein
VLPVPIVQKVKLLLTAAPKPYFVMPHLYTQKPVTSSLILTSDDSSHLHEFKRKKIVFKSDQVASEKFTTMMNFMVYANLAIQTVRL